MKYLLGDYCSRIDGRGREKSSDDVWIRYASFEICYYYNMIIVIIIMLSCYIILFDDDVVRNFIWND